MDDERLALSTLAQIQRLAPLAGRPDLKDQWNGARHRVLVSRVAAASRFSNFFAMPCDHPVWYAAAAINTIVVVACAGVGCADPALQVVVCR